MISGKDTEKTREFIGRIQLWLCRHPRYDRFGSTVAEGVRFASPVRRAWQALPNLRARLSRVAA